MMKKKPTLIVVSLFLALGLSACDQPGPAEQAGKKMDQIASDTGKKVGETVDKVEQKISAQSERSAQVLNDSEITAKVKTELLLEPGLKSMQIGVDTVNGVVTLTGTVDSQASRDQASARTMTIGGVKDVNNRLVVTSPK